MFKTFLALYIAVMRALSWYGWRMLRVEVKEPRNLVHERWCMEMVLGLRIGNHYSYDSAEKYWTCVEEL